MHWCFIVFKVLFKYLFYTLVQVSWMLSLSQWVIFMLFLFVYLLRQGSSTALEAVLEFTQ